MKIGDWCQHFSSEDRYYVFAAEGNTIAAVNLLGYTRFDTLDNFTPLPGCTGWDWKPITAGEGYRLIDIKVDNPQEGDEYLHSIDGWNPRSLNTVNFAS